MYYSKLSNVSLIQLALKTKMIKVEEIWCEQKRIYFIWGAESLILATVSLIHFILGLFLLPGSG